MFVFHFLRLIDAVRAIVLKRSEDLAQTMIARLVGNGTLVLFLYTGVELPHLSLERPVGWSYQRGVEEEVVDQVQVKLALHEALHVLGVVQTDRSLQHSPDSLCVPSSMLRVHICMM